MSSKKWLKLWVLIFSISILLVALFNYKIDSLGLVAKKGYLDLAAKALANGKIISGLNNFDERLFRKKIIENINYEIEWIAIGSSRTMQLRKRMFLKKDVGFQNYSVSGASLEDYMALIQAHYNKFNSYPQNIILGIDPWIFNRHNGQNRFLTLEDEYNQFLSILGHDNKKQHESTNNYKKLFSVEYFIENLKFVKNNFDSGLKGFEIVTSIDIDTQLREPDGSIQYPLKSRFPDSNEVKKSAIQYTKGSVYSLERFDRINNKKLFNHFVKFLQQNKITVYFYLPPYNPYTYDILVEKKEYQIINEVELFLSSLANKYNIKIIGSYNPHKYGFTNEDFFDGMHSLDSVYIILFKDLIAI
ncbi:hypothetical protein JWV37_01110 [Sulfurospirillum sp. T05]|uniref:Uncharacterized protein n=1 Tax=Sulfurospirillum tamanense TaxID=2813362 RepID=A0ABS2WP06_9BACT|nr:hypothetical protein [Sulfurospirillum tamanensis]MBN2963367.1 hypothetical protein [Sulfurospirillum tamanensis]